MHYLLFLLSGYLTPRGELQQGKVWVGDSLRQGKDYIVILLRNFYENIYDSTGVSVNKNTKEIRRMDKMELVKEGI